MSDRSGKSRDRDQEVMRQGAAEVSEMLRGALQRATQLAGDVVDDMELSVEAELLRQHIVDAIECAERHR